MQLQAACRKPVKQMSSDYLVSCQKIHVACIDRLQNDTFCVHLKICG